MVRRVSQSLNNFWNWFILTDPGLIRLRMATWAVLTAGISYLILSYLSELLNQPSAVSLLGVIVGVSAIAVNDPDLPDQRITTLLLPLPALMAVVLGELVAPIPVIQELVLLAIVFVAVRLRRFGARGTILGLVIFMTYLFSFNLGLQANQLPWAVISILTGTLIAFLIRFVILPGRLDFIFRQNVRAFQASTNALLASLIGLVQNPHRQDRFRPTIRSYLYKIGDLAIDLENLLGPPQDTSAPEDPVEVWRSNLLEFELALETLVNVTGQIMQGKSFSPEKLAGLVEFFHTLEESVKSKKSAQTLHLDILEISQDKPGNAAFNLAMNRLEWAAQTLIKHNPSQVPVEVEEHLKTSNLFSPHPSASQVSADNLKLAVRATIAVGLAIIVGVLISGTRWYWAVIAAFVLFVRASTIEETLSRAWQRVAGTLVGVVVGIFLVQIIIDDPRLEVILLLAGFFTAYFLVTLTYTGFVFVLTVVLAILYRLLGTFQPGLLVVRLEETLAGAAVGVLVTLFIFPKYSSTKNKKNMTKVMQKISQAFEPMIPGAERAELFDQLRHTVREIDQEIKILRGDLSSLGGRFLSLSSPATRERVHILSLLGIAIRHYLVSSRLSQPEPQFQQQTSAIERHLAENAMTIAKALEDQTSPVIRPIENPLVQGMQASPTAAYTSEQSAALQWLARIDRLQGDIAGDPKI
jgi:uncharacterized membrane protein YgaE (UPF0421/DUF939 family)